MCFYSIFNVSFTNNGSILYFLKWNCVLIALLNKPKAIDFFQSIYSRLSIRIQNSNNKCTIVTSRSKTVNTIIWLLKQQVQGIYSQKCLRCKFQCNSKQIYKFFISPCLRRAHQDQGLHFRVSLMGSLNWYRGSLKWVLLGFAQVQIAMLDKGHCSP